MLIEFQVSIKNYSKIFLLKEMVQLLIVNYYEML